MLLTNLNFPSFKVRIVLKENKYYTFCLVRKKYVKLTPEEWVRQHMLNYMNKLGYSYNLMSLETNLNYNKLKKRADITIFDKNSKIIFLIECKAPNVILNENTLNQISIYNKNLNSQYLIITNGLKIYCLKKKNDSNYIIINSIPYIYYS